MKKAWIFAGVLLLLAGCSDAASPVATAPAHSTKKADTSHTKTKDTKQTAIDPASIKGRWVTVTKVSDGDTFEVDNGEKVRLIGVNTPETVKPGTPVMPYGKEASDYAKSKLSGKKVYLEVDVKPTDQYGRTLGYLFLQQPKTAQDVEQYMFNATLLREGYAQLMTISPNVKYADLFVTLQKQAREANKGLWALGIYKDSVKSTNDVYLEGKASKTTKK